jgi:hypothetical protein
VPSLTYVIHFVVADLAYNRVIYFKPGIPQSNAISEAKISIIVTRLISIAVMYYDADEVVNQ